MKQASIISIVENREGFFEGDLAHYFQALINDATNIANPYHNLRHILHVFWECYNGAKYHRISSREMRNLLIAALFHDFNHSGKLRGRDHEEVEVAIMSLKNYLLPEEGREFEDIATLIKATQFPYVIPDEDLSVSAMILRDADMSQNFSPVWIQQCWLGLAEEMGVDPIKFLKMQPAFLKSIKFHSNWGKDEFNPRRAIHIQEIEEYIEILDRHNSADLRRVA